MKVQVKNSNNEFLFEGTSEEFKEVLESRLINNATVFSNNTNLKNYDDKEIKNDYDYKEKEYKAERPTVRKRLPSDEEIEIMRNNSMLSEEDLQNIDYIDLSNIDIKKSKSIAIKNFMCPNCKQWASIKINGNLIFKDVESEEKTLYQLKSNDKVNNIKNNNDLINFSADDWEECLAQSDIAIVSNDYIDGECVCCGKVYPTSKWYETFKAYESDINQICPICGSLMCYNIERNETTTRICENKHCNYELKEM